jgi:hypothetical protein
MSPQQFESAITVGIPLLCCCATWFMGFIVGRLWDRDKKRGAP